MSGASDDAMRDGFESSQLCLATNEWVWPDALVAGTRHGRPLAPFQPAQQAGDLDVGIAAQLRAGSLDVLLEEPDRGDGIAV